MQVEHLGKPSDYPGFKEIQREWQRRLAESGFKDIEEPNGHKLKKTGTQGRFERAPQIVKEAKAKYYEIIGQKIVETTFDDEQEKQILTLYFEGYTQAKIRKTIIPTLHRSTIYKKLYKWLRAWGLK